MPNIGAPELILILIVALLVIGPGKLPEVGSALGKSIREFRKATTEVQESVRVELGSPAQSATSAQPAPQAQPAPVAQPPSQAAVPPVVPPVAPPVAPPQPAADPEAPQVTPAP